VDVLDVGCGVRFTQTIVNGGIPIGSYTGVDVHEPLVRFLQTQVHDPRFTFAHWDVANPLYNPAAPAMTRASTLPVSGEFDVVWLFSVFTHLAPAEADAMLHVLRRHVRAEGRLLFSAFVDPAVGTFEEKAPEQPGALCTYGEPHLREIVVRNGWRVASSHEKDPAKYIQHHFVCTPA
jgi:SAM-dependent methyltransferase